MGDPVWIVLGGHDGGTGLVSNQDGDKVTEA